MTGDWIVVRVDSWSDGIECVTRDDPSAGGVVYTEVALGTLGAYRRVRQENDGWTLTGRAKPIPYAKAQAMIRKVSKVKPKPVDMRKRDAEAAIPVLKRKRAKPDYRNGSTMTPARIDSIVRRIGVLQPAVSAAIQRRRERVAKVFEDMGVTVTCDWRAGSNKIRNICPDLTKVEWGIRTWPRTGGGVQKVLYVRDYGRIEATAAAAALKALPADVFAALPADDRAWAERLGTRPAPPDRSNDWHACDDIRGQWIQVGGVRFRLERSGPVAGVIKVGNENARRMSAAELVRFVQRHPELARHFPPKWVARNLEKNR